MSFYQWPHPDFLISMRSSTSLQRYVQAIFYFTSQLLLPPQILSAYHFFSSFVMYHLFGILFYSITINLIHFHTLAIVFSPDTLTCNLSLLQPTCFHGNQITLCITQLSGFSLIWTIQCVWMAGQRVKILSLGIQVLPTRALPAFFHPSTFHRSQINLLSSNITQGMSQLYLWL